MSRDARPWFYALTLLAGSLTVGVAGVRHPMLVGDGADQLTVIAATGGWRAIHWAFAAGYVAVVAGLAARGHTVVPAANPLGTAQAIWIDWERGILRGGADGRRDGIAAGW